MVLESSLSSHLVGVGQRAVFGKMDDCSHITFRITYFDDNSEHLNSVTNFLLYI